MIDPEKLKQLLGIGGMSRPDTAQPTPQMAAVMPPPVQPPRVDPRQAQIDELNSAMPVPQDTRPHLQGDEGAGKQVLFAVLRGLQGMGNKAGYQGMVTDEQKQEMDRQGSLLDRIKMLQGGMQTDRGLDIQEGAQNRLFAQNQAEQAYRQQQEARLSKAEQDKMDLERQKLDVGKFSANSEGVLNTKTGELTPGTGKTVADKEIDTYTNKTGHRVTIYQRPDNTQYEVEAKGEVQPPSISTNPNRQPGSEDDVKWIADQIDNDATGTMFTRLTSGNERLKSQVRTELASRKSDIHNLTAASRQLGETAHELMPNFATTIAMLDEPNIASKLGPVQGRWQEFLAGRVGSGDPDLVRLRTFVNLLQTGAMRAHIGARGGQALLDKFEKLFNSQKMDVPTLRSALSSTRDFLGEYEKAVYPNGKAEPLQEYERDPANPGKLRLKR